MIPRAGLIGRAACASGVPVACRLKVNAMLKRISSSALIAAGLMFCLAACTTTSSPPRAAGAAAAPAPVAAGCLETGSRIASDCAAPGRSYDQRDIRTTGQTDAQQALRMLDPSVTLQGR